MRILLVDNYDSFTYNLAHQIERVTGISPIIRRNDEITVEQVESMGIGAIVLSPGPGRPDRARDFGVCAELIRRTRIACLGVCLGHQGIVHNFGGRIDKAWPPMHGRRSRIFHDGEGIFGGVPQGFFAMRYHSLVAWPPLPEGLKACAFTEDQVMMAVRNESRTLWGVQFHPESIRSEHGDTIVANFFRLAGIDEQACPPTPRATGAGGASDARSPDPGARSQSTARAEELRVIAKQLEFAVAPEKAYEALYLDRPESFWLDGGGARDSGWGASYMGAIDGPLAYSVSYRRRSRTLDLRRRGAVERRAEALLDFLRRQSAEVRSAPHDLPFEFVGGFVGYLGYEMKGDFGAETRHSSPLPDAFLLFVDRMVVFAGPDERPYLVALAGPHEERSATEWIAETELRLRRASAESPPPDPARGRAGAARRFELRTSRDDYVARVRACQARIEEGQSYELCFTTTFDGPALEQPFAVYRALRARNPAPFSAFLKTPDGAVLSASPELFLKIDPAGRVTSRPIKGTAPRDPDPAADQARRGGLEVSEKNQAENVMIVDLVRHDLGRVCEPGSVEVPELMAIETFSTVHQMVSTVRGKLRPGMSPIECIEAAFPPGSMTGAPKLRSMELLEELEGAARGIYSGAIGFIGTHGGATLSVVIRTIVSTPHGTSIGVGGAVTALSHPQEELAEAMLKGRALLEAIDSVEGPSPADRAREGRDGY